jgi:hypothetical protein
VNSRTTKSFPNRHRKTAVGDQRIEHRLPFSRRCLKDAGSIGADAVINPGYGDARGGHVVQNEESEDCLSVHWPAMKNCPHAQNHALPLKPVFACEHSCP